MCPSPGADVQLERRLRARRAGRGRVAAPPFTESRGNGSVVMYRFRLPYRMGKGPVRTSQKFGKCLVRHDESEPRFVRY
jgi:hypothetical protein